MLYIELTTINIKFMVRSFVYTNYIYIFVVQILKYMKVKLLKKIRNKGRNIITIYSTTTETTFRGSYCTCMSYGFTGDEYKGLFSFGDTEEQVKEKAMNIYIKKEIDNIRKRFKKYSRKYKLSLFY